MILVLWLLAGLAGGTAHFALLHRNAALYVAGGGLTRALALQALRMAAIAALLAFAAWHGALPLLLATAGVWLARVLVLRLTAPVP